jgi:hypothetical protein
LQPDSHPRLLSPVLQLDSLKLKSCKCNIIINITLGSSVAAKPKAFWCIFAKIHNPPRS